MKEPLPQEATIPFSSQLLELFQEYRRAQKQEDRQRLSQKIAKAFYGEWDPTDETGTEDYHEFFESYAKALLAYQHESSRLTRLAVQLIDSYLTAHEIDLDDPSSDNPRRAN